MGKFSEIAAGSGPPERMPPERIPVDISVRPYMRDHVSRGRIVLPAVEAMQLLAGAAACLQPGLDVLGMAGSTFRKFLVIDPADEKIAAFARVEAVSADAVTLALMTRQPLKSGFSRNHEHARLRFGSPAADALNTAEPLEIPDGEPDGEPDMQVAADRVYAELVPFGPAYQNIAGSLRLYADCAAAEVRAADYPQSAGPLGSPFPLDAAFHAACVWCQRYQGFVGFPVGFDRRVIRQRTCPGETYSARAFPVTVDQGRCLFDIWLSQPENGAFEVIHGVRMQDVSGGGVRPPGWIGEGRH